MRTRRHFLAIASGATRRCHNPVDSNYPRYGGRGIDVFPAWRTNRSAFVAYISALVGAQDRTLSLDRIDNAAGYHPGNLRWATRRVQQRNSRRAEKNRTAASIGATFGEWTVIGACTYRDGTAHVPVVCVCGTKSVVRVHKLTSESGRSRSCRPCGARRMWVRRHRAR